MTHTLPTLVSDREPTDVATLMIEQLSGIAFASMADFIAIAADGTLDAVRAVVERRSPGLKLLDVKERPVSAKKGGGRIRRLRIRLECKLTALDALSRCLGRHVVDIDLIGPLAGRIHEEYARIAFANISDYLDIQPDGSARLDLLRATSGQMAALSAIDVEQHIDRPDGLPPLVHHMHLQLAAKHRALDALARHTKDFWTPRPIVGDG